jgi:hypothetical protein
MTNAFVQQLGRGNTVASQSNAGGEHTVLRTYKFYDIFPTNISEIALSYDSSDAIEEFTVDFQVQYWTVGESAQSTGSSVNEVEIS